MTATTAPTTPLDREKAAAFVERLKQTYQHGMLTILLDLAARTGVLEELATGPGTADHLATRLEQSARHLRELLSGLAVAEVVTYDAATEMFALPPEHALWLTGARATNLAPMAGLIAGLAPRLDDVEATFRNGGGVPYDNYRPHFTHAMDAVGRARYDELLVTKYLPAADGLVERLRNGARVADVGCGTGHCINLMAAAFPESQFIGYDFSEEAITLARREAVALGITNATFEVCDVLALPTDPAFDVIFAFDAIHDQADPSGVLARIRAALAPDGTFFMVDIKASSRLEENLGDPTKLIIYGTSVMHCMQVSLAAGGAGLGTAWGTELATQMLRDAGFAAITVRDIERDPTNCIYVSRND